MADATNEKPPKEIPILGEFHGSEDASQLFSEVSTGVRATLNMAVLKARLGGISKRDAAASIMAALSLDMCAMAVNLGIGHEALLKQISKDYYRVLTEISDADGSA